PLLWNTECAQAIHATMRTPHPRFIDGGSSALPQDSSALGGCRTGERDEREERAEDNAANLTQHRQASLKQDVRSGDHRDERLLGAARRQHLIVERYEVVPRSRGVILAVTANQNVDLCDRCDVPISKSI